MHSCVCFPSPRGGAEASHRTQHDSKTRLSPCTGMDAWLWDLPRRRCPWEQKSCLFRAGHTSESLVLSITPQLRRVPVPGYPWKGGHTAHSFPIPNLSRTGPRLGQGYGLFSEIPQHLNSSGAPSLAGKIFICTRGRRTWPSQSTAVTLGDPWNRHRELKSPELASSDKPRWVGEAGCNRERSLGYYFKITFWLSGPHSTLSPEGSPPCLGSRREQEIMPTPNPASPDQGHTSGPCTAGSGRLCGSRTLSEQLRVPQRASSADSGLPASRGVLVTRWDPLADLGRGATTGP